ncbi:MAG: helix-turn-helix domain-containing protein [Thermofilaceae archaeon]
MLELGARYITPYIMRRLVKALVNEHGLSRVKAAAALGISPSAVTRYLKGERGSQIDLRDRSDVEELISRLASRAASRPLSELELQLEVARIALYIMGKGYACPFHFRLEPSLGSTGCGVCRSLFGPSTPNSSPPAVEHQL